MIERVFEDERGKRILFSDLGVTWMSDERLAAMGLMEVDSDYVEPVDAAVTLANAKTAKQNRIKALLTATDYKCLKFVDGDLSAEEYAAVKAYRTALRTAYNAVEAATTVEEVEAVTWE